MRRNEDEEGTRDEKKNGRSDTEGRWTTRRGQRIRYGSEGEERGANGRSDTEARTTTRSERMVRDGIDDNDEEMIGSSAQRGGGTRRDNQEKKPDSYDTLYYRPIDSI